MSRFNEWYDYLNPINYFGTIYDNIHNDGYQFGDISAGLFGIDRTSVAEGVNEAQATQVMDPQTILGEVTNDSRQQFEDDRAHTEMREDTAYQRAVSDMRKAGLNPYTVGASPAAASASKVGENNIANKVQMLGYLLDLKNLDFKNKQLANSVIGNLIKVVA